MKQVKLTNEDIGSLCMSLAYLIHSGLGAGDALTLMAEDEESPGLRELLSRMKDRADEGQPLADVFRETGCFPTYVCTLLDVGEQVGKLEDALNSLGEYYSDRARMNRQLRNALLYPALLFVVLLAVIVVLLVWVLPVFNDVYAQMGSSLSGLAGSLLGIGMALKNAMPVLCAVLLAVLVLAVVLSASAPARKKCMEFWRRRMGDKGVFHAIYTARFAQALAMGMSSGLPQDQAVQLAATLSEGAPAFRRSCEECLSRLEQGESLPQALKSVRLLPHTECRLLDAGVRSGCAENVMEQTAQRLLEDSQAQVEALVSRIEPALVVVCCVMVGAILLSVMLPLMHIMSTIG